MQIRSGQSHRRPPSKETPLLTANYFKNAPKEKLFENPGRSILDLKGPIKIKIRELIDELTPKLHKPARKIFVDLPKPARKKLVDLPKPARKKSVDLLDSIYKAVYKKKGKSRIGAETKILMEEIKSVKKLPDIVEDAPRTREDDLQTFALQAVPYKRGETSSKPESTWYQLDLLSDKIRNRDLNLKGGQESLKEMGFWLNWFENPPDGIKVTLDPSSIENLDRFKKTYKKFKKILKETKSRREEAITFNRQPHTVFFGKKNGGKICIKDTVLKRINNLIKNIKNSSNSLEDRSESLKILNELLNTIDDKKDQVKGFRESKFRDKDALKKYENSCDGFMGAKKFVRENTKGGFKASWNRIYKWYPGEAFFTMVLEGGNKGMFVIMRSVYDHFDGLTEKFNNKKTSQEKHLTEMKNLLDAINDTNPQRLTTISKKNLSKMTLHYNTCLKEWNKRDN